MRARELGVELALVSGTGPGGRIVERDVLGLCREPAQGHADGGQGGRGPGRGSGDGDRHRRGRQGHAAGCASAAAPAAQPRRLLPAALAPVAPIKVLPAEVAATVPLSGLRGIIAERMASSAHSAARVTLVSEVDATAFVEVRTRLKAAVSEEWGFAPGYTDLLATIVARALREYPYMNARLNGDVIEQLTHVNVGIAVDVERGLMVPVLHDADQMGLRELGIAVPRGGGSRPRGQEPAGRSCGRHVYDHQPGHV